LERGTNVAASVGHTASGAADATTCRERSGAKVGKTVATEARFRTGVGSGSAFRSARGVPENEPLDGFSPDFVLGPDSTEISNAAGDIAATENSTKAMKAMRSLLKSLSSP